MTIKKDEEHNVQGVCFGFVCFFKAQFGRNQKPQSDLEYTGTDVFICFGIIASKMRSSSSVRIL